MKGRRPIMNHQHQSPPSETDLPSPTKDQQAVDRLLPIANVSRIMKRSLPPNAKISKEAKETVQECVSEFISFVTGEASDKCQREKRKTVNGDDLLWAMTTLGFENYVSPLKIYLNKYRESEGEKDVAVPGGNGGTLVDGGYGGMAMDPDSNLVVNYGTNGGVVHGAQW